MRVLCLVNARLPTERAHGHQTVRMCEAFASLGHQVELWHPRRRQPDEHLARADVHAYYEVAPVFRVRTLPNLDVIRLERALPPRLFPAVVGAHAVGWGLTAALTARSTRPGLCFTRDPEIAFWCVCLGLPTAWEVHGLPGGPRSRLVRAVAARDGLRAVLPLTSPLRDALLAFGMPARKLTVLPSAVDLERFDALPAKEGCRAAVGLAPGRPTVGFVGRFEALGQGRGLDLLVRAVADPRLRDVDLVCVGGPREVVPALRALGRSLGLEDDRMRFLDRVPPQEAARWARALDVAVIPSPSSAHYARATSPLKLFEYMAAGTPIVASDLPSAREVLTHGRSAWLVAPDDAGALADGLVTVLGDAALADRLATTAARAVRPSTWQARAAQVMAVASGHPVDAVGETTGGR